MWVNHSEDLGKPSVSPCFDHEFSDRVATRVRNIFASCENELPGTLNEPLQYQEVFNVCSKLKSVVSLVLIDYEHIRFGGPILWKLKSVPCFCSLLEWCFVISIGTCWDWFQRTSVLITAQKNL